MDAPTNLPPPARDRAPAGMTASDVLRPITRLALAACAVLVAAAVLVLVLNPVVLSDTNVVDAMFLTEVAWRIYHGWLPGVDFGHFYGGLTEQVVAFSMKLFGPSMKALDQAMVILWAGLAAASALVARRRLGRTGFWMLFVVVSAVILSKASMHQTAALIARESTYGSLYNRLGSAIGCLVMVFVLLPASARWAERAGAVLTGLALALLMLVKPPFAVLVPAALAALAVQRRWESLALTALAGIASAMLLDPGAARFLGSIRYVDAIDVGVATPADLVKKGVQLLLMQPLQTASALFGLVLVAALGGRQGVAWAIAALLTGAALIAMASTMSAPWSVGQQAVPFLAAFAIVAAARSPAGDSPVLTVLALLMTLSYAVPLLLNTVAVGAYAATKRHLLLFEEGPMAPYLGLGEFPIEDPRGGPRPLAVLAAEAADPAAEGRMRDAALDYVVLADGVRALTRAGLGAGRTGIVSEKFSFNFATGAAPVLDFPTYQRETAPELATDRPFPDEVGAVLLLRRPGRNFRTHDRVRARMGSTFRPCVETEIWEVHVRRGIPDLDCAED